MSKTIYSVKQLNDELRNLLESNYNSIWVEGEISGLATPASGHMYFSLKEENSVIRCAFFRNRQSRNFAGPSEGMQVLLSGQISYYEPRGDLQFIVTFMEESGEGTLRRAFEALKQKLEKEGLFNEDSKINLPKFPKVIGIVTSDTGAALHDMIITLKGRYPICDIIIYPSLVQGKEAPKSLIQAMDIAEKRNEVDVLVIARGGGSLEDLQAFNDEGVARRVFNCKLPVVSAIGHEIDFTICDFVADQRAATPTAAATRVTPEIVHVKSQFAALRGGLMTIAGKTMQTCQQTLDYTSARLIHPKQRLAGYDARHRELSKTITLFIQQYIELIKNNIEKNSRVISAHSPQSRLKYLRQQIDGNQQSLETRITQKIKNMHQMLNQYRGNIQIMDPHHTLGRGYALVQNQKEKVITSPGQVAHKDGLQITVAKGKFNVIVEDN